MNNQGEYVNVNAPKPDTFPINKNTTYVIEHYYKDENRILKEQINSIPEFLGYNKKELEDYCRNYTKYCSSEEKQEGLYSLELISYKDDVITLKKSYCKKRGTSFIAKSFNGMVVILNSDGKTVYEYTDINVGTLPEELSQSISEGLVFETEEELYNFLENYSS